MASTVTAATITASRAATTATAGPWPAGASPSKAEMLQALEGARSLPAQSLTGEMAGACGAKTLCKQMLTCEEAMHYLNDCGLTRLDRDGDGVPCESLCR